MKGTPRFTPKLLETTPKFTPNPNTETYFGVIGNTPLRSFTPLTTPRRHATALERLRGRPTGGR